MAIEVDGDVIHAASGFAGTVSAIVAAGTEPTEGWVTVVGTHPGGLVETQTLPLSELEEVV